MNSKPKTEKTEEIEITVGQRLLEARETLGYSQEIIAERLCLKVSTIREIEEGSNSYSIDPTFLRGYIRSYAKLVKISEKEILELLDKHMLAKVAVVSPMQSYSIEKTCNKREVWAMKFTWLILIICITMVGIWWWQGHKIQEQEIITMVKRNQSNSTQMSTDLSSSITDDAEEGTKQNNIKALSTETSSIHPDATSAITNKVISPEVQSILTSTKLKNRHMNISNELINPTEVKIVQPLGGITNNSNLEQIKPDESSVSNIKSGDAIVMNFKGHCWLEIRDAKGKILFRGMQKAGQKLELNGELPYDINIGMPANINLLFKNNSIDLSRFIQANRPAKFKLPRL